MSSDKTPATANAPVRDWAWYASRREHGRLGYDPRMAAPVTRGWLWLAYKTAGLLASARVSPNTVTAAGVGFGALVPVLALRGSAWPVLAAVIVLLSAFADTVDGMVALILSRSSRLGRVYDSVADRLTEATWLAGFWVLGAPGWLLTVCLALSWLYEYARVAAGATGMAGTGRVTVGERRNRVILMVSGMLLAGLGGLVGPEFAAGVCTLVAAAWVLLGGMGLLHLILAIRGVLRRQQGRMPSVDERGRQNATAR